MEKKVILYYVINNGILWYNYSYFIEHIFLKSETNIIFINISILKHPKSRLVNNCNYTGGIIK